MSDSNIEVMTNGSKVQQVDPSQLFGKHECQVSKGGEASLHEHFNDCKKNPDHKQFIPVSTFTIEHLPVGHRDEDLYQLIKATADLTVRISINTVSHKRPQFWPGTNVPYPFCNMGGNEDVRTGSGKVTVCMYKDGYGYNGRGINVNLTGDKYEREYKTCPCEKSQLSDQPSNVWWEIIVTTATHVVFDDIEARHMACRLFFDEEDSPLVVLDNFSIANVDTERDRCQLKYLTCDPTLGNELYKMSERRVSLWDKVLHKYKDRLDDRLIFIISHPHGCHKHVTIGEWIDNHRVAKYNEEFYLTKLTYTTCTCPGSSGARVYCVGFSGASHIHNGSLDSGLNYSSVDLFKK